MNEILGFIVIATAAGALMVAYAPDAAKWLALVLYARAMAVESAREAYDVVMRSGIEVRPVMFVPGKDLESRRRSVAVSACGETR